MVILIILIVSAVALPTVLPALNHRQVSEAARILQGALVGARDKAIHDNQPSGIRLLPDPTFAAVYLDSRRHRINADTALAYNRDRPDRAGAGVQRGLLYADAREYDHLFRAPP